MYKTFQIMKHSLQLNQIIATSSWGEAESLQISVTCRIIVLVLSTAAWISFCEREMK